MLSLLLVLFLLTGCSKLTAPHPKEIGDPPSGFPADPVTIHSRSGSELSGWYLQGEPVKAGILLMHGVGSNRMQMFTRAKFLHQEGYSVLLFDFLGHGQSSGDKITFGLKESLDAEAAYAYLESKLKNKSIGVIGVSLGGAAALVGNVAKQADALVLESVYPTIREAIENRVVMYLGEFGKIFTSILTMQLKPQLGFSAEELKPIDHISTVHGAVLIIAGTDDKRTTIEQSRQLYAQGKEPKQIWEIQGAEHENFHNFTTEEYELKVLRFFDSYLNSWTGGLSD